MPKSKRSKLVHLTQTKTKGKQGKEKLVTEIHAAILKYTSIYVFEPANTRNNHLKDLRLQFRTSRFFFGKNKVIIKAIEASDKPEIQKLIPYIIGQRGLLFTNEPTIQVQSFFSTFSVADYPRGGFVATRDVVIPAGPMVGHAGSLEPRFRSLGLPTRLNDGVIELLGNHAVCRKGKAITPEQASILTLIEDKMSLFTIKLLVVWTEGKFESFVEEDGVQGDASDEEELSDD